MIPNTAQIQEDAPHEIHVYPYVNLSDPNNMLGTDFAIFTKTYLPPGPQLELRLDGEYFFDSRGTATLRLQETLWKDELDHYMQVAKFQGYSLFERLVIRRQMFSLIRNTIPDRALPYVLTPFLIKELRGRKIPKDIEHALEALEDLQGFHQFRNWNYISYDSQQLNVLSQKNWEKIYRILQEPPVKNNILPFKRIKK